MKNGVIKIIDRLFRQLFKLDLQTRLIVGFVIAAGLTGFVATLVGIWTINRITIAEIQNRVSQDINTAKLIYNHDLEKIGSLLKFSVEGSDLCEVVSQRNIQKMGAFNGMIRRVQVTQTSGEYQFLDMLSIVDGEGSVLYRAANPKERGDSMLWDPVIRKCIEERKLQLSTELMPVEKIVQENPALLERVTIETVRTPRSVEPQERRLAKGMVMRAAYPILDERQKLHGVLVGGVLLSRDRSIVDKVRETIYHDEQYKGRQMGVATIFQDGVRISTNVMTKENTRAVGTMLSREVYDRVIKEGRDWVGRAFVVNDWYITTYTPIYNSEGNRVGILYTGILEEKYRDIQWRMIFISLGITTFGMIVAFVISFRMGNTIINRIRILKRATQAIAAGNLDYKLSPDKAAGLDMLDAAFNDMAKSLKDRDERLQNVYERLARSEKLTALGEMAAGVAHEINNPLGGILLYSNLVLEDIAEGNPARENMKKIIYQTNRCKNIVQNLLDFARSPTGDMRPLKVNEVVETSLNLVRNQSLFHGIDIETRFAPELPDVVGDLSRLEEVFLNLFINAADAMKESGGKLTITTAEGGSGWVRIIITDSGKGISREDLPHIFEPFFTTKEPGQGTGLGLSIAYGVIRKHNGFIDAESTPGKGTTFTVSLPVHDSKNDGGVKEATACGRPKEAVKP